MSGFSLFDYDAYKNIFHNYRFPLAFVDLNRFDENIEYVGATQKNSGKTIRIASKSIRSIPLIKRIFKKGGRVFQGILSYTMEEADFLISQGLDDIIVAYPSIQPSDIKLFVKNVQAGAKLSMVIDGIDHLKVLSQAGQRAGSTLNLCMDVDMSFRPFGRISHIGVRRSPVYKVQEAIDLARASLNLKGILINSIMGYEAQIASANDNYPDQPIKNAVLRWIKNLSNKELSQRRKSIVKAVQKTGIQLENVNGGGSGSLVSTGRDMSVTEVTAGSAFFAPGLFRFFKEVEFSPSAFFGLRVVRIPDKEYLTCQGGGYIGSGDINETKLPCPVMPVGLSLLGIEGAGEVQTPLKKGPDCPNLAIGDPVFFQHAKAGELCERFNELYLVQDQKIVGKALTYRGEGHAFL